MITISIKRNIILFFTLGSIFFLAACDTTHKTKIEFINSKINSTTTAKEISIKELARKYKSLDGQVIQTEGIVYFEFENVSICVDRGLNSGCFWLDYNPDDLRMNDSLLMEASNQKLVIKGTLDISRKGHFGAYLATIKNIYYIKSK
ncbi:MAG: hypothetical protein H6549_08370 [Chitinophagales bacterium]|nr:hypothetical protein [Chitinophagales bacterium]